MIESEHLDLVRRSARRLKARLPNTVELDDLVQAGMLGLLGALAAHDPQTGPFENYANIRVRGAMVDEVRKTTAWCRAARQSRVLSCEPAEFHEIEAPEESPPISAEEARALNAAIATLNARQRRFLDLYYRDELTLTQTAEVLQVTPSRACQMHRAVLSKLRAVLEHPTPIAHPNPIATESMSQIHRRPCEFESYPLALAYGWTVYK